MTIPPKTNRLILRELHETDVEGMFQLDSDPLVHRYLGNRTIQNRTQAQDVIAAVRKQYMENGIGRWAIVEKESGEFVGWTGLKLVREPVNGHQNYYDLGYRILPAYWGKGYATESAAATLDYGFKQMGLDTIYAAAHVENIASNRILQKLGFTYKETFFYDGSMHNWYELPGESLTHRRKDKI